MPLFKYTAQRNTGERYTAEKEATDRFELYSMIRAEGDSIVEVHEKSAHTLLKKPGITLFSRVGMHDKILFARNLGSMIKAGLSVSRALEVMGKQARNAKLKSVLNSLTTEIAAGKTLSLAMKTHADVFSPLVISMTAAGEESGNLAESLRIVALQMDSVYSLKKKIRGAMMYPAIILSAMIIIGVLMLIFVVPTLTSTFKELNVALPLSTQLVLGLSDFIRLHYLIALLIVAIFGFGGYLVSKTAQGKKLFDYLVIRLPVIGPLVKEVNAARTARTLSSLLSSGVELVESVRITKTVLQNVYYKQILERSESDIQKGIPLSEIFIKEEALYPIFVGEMMSVGEETGALSEMLLQVAVFYEDDVEQKTKDLSTIIEPILMILIGTAVGFFAVSMISPTYSVLNTI